MTVTKSQTVGSHKVPCGRLTFSQKKTYTSEGLALKNYTVKCLINPLLKYFLKDLVNLPMVLKITRFSALRKINSNLLVSQGRMEHKFYDSGP